MKARRKAPTCTEDTRIPARGPERIQRALLFKPRNLRVLPIAYDNTMGTDVYSNSRNGG